MTAKGREAIGHRASALGRKRLGAGNWNAEAEVRGEEGNLGRVRRGGAAKRYPDQGPAPRHPRAPHPPE